MEGKRPEKKMFQALLEIQKILEPFDFETQCAMIEVVEDHLTDPSKKAPKLEFVEEPGDSGDYHDPSTAKTVDGTALPITWQPMAAKKHKSPAKHRGAWRPPPAKRKEAVVVNLTKITRLKVDPDNSWMVEGGNYPGPRRPNHFPGMVRVNNQIVKKRIRTWLQGRVELYAKRENVSVHQASVMLGMNSAAMYYMNRLNRGPSLNTLQMVCNKEKLRFTDVLLYGEAK